MLDESNCGIITNVKLRQLLETLPNDFMIAVSQTGNLILRDAINQYHGYIDLNKEHVETFDEQ
jgi:hypothetical protein